MLNGVLVERHGWQLSPAPTLSHLTLGLVITRPLKPLIVLALPLFFSHFVESQSSAEVRQMPQGQAQQTSIFWIMTLMCCSFKECSTYCFNIPRKTIFLKSTVGGCGDEMGQANQGDCLDGPACLYKSLPTQHFHWYPLFFFFFFFVYSLPRVHATVCDALSRFKDPVRHLASSTLKQLLWMLQIQVLMDRSNDRQKKWFLVALVNGTQIEFSHL